MLEKLSTNSHQSWELVTCYPYPYARFENKHLMVFPILLKGSMQASAGVSDFSPLNPSLKLLQKSWQRSSCSYTMSTGNRGYHFVHYFHTPCCPSKCYLSSLVSYLGCKSEGRRSHLFVLLCPSVKLEDATACTSETSALWQHRDHYSHNSSTKDWSREQMVFRGHRLFCPDLFEKKKKKEERNKREH